jgi:hypothetical protein
MSDDHTASAHEGLELVGVYVDDGGASHRVHVTERGRLSWEIRDTPEEGEPVVIDRLRGELESADTAAAVARDYLTQVQRRAA